MKILQEIYHRRELLVSLAVRNLKIRYKGSVLGFFWSLLDPLLMMLVYLAFIRIMRFSIELPVLLTGIIVWQFFVMCTNDSVHIITGSTNLVKKIYFPRLILPLAMVVANVINFLLSTGVLLILLLVFRVPLGIPLMWFPVILLFQCIFCLGMALLVSCSNVFFRDTEHLVGVVLMAWFFLTPIIYPVTKVPEQFIGLYFLNPMAALVAAYRYALLSKPLPQVPAFYLAFALIIFVFLLGWMIFSRYQKYFADEL